MTNKIRVRFAPSPTGPLHIGGLRTALFNYLYAKKHNGNFIVRIEDTDQNRYVEGSENHILSSLEWCGLKIDELHRQSERKNLYDLYIVKLLDLKKAYYAFDTKEELDLARKEAEKKGKVFSYNAFNRLNFKNSLSLKKNEVDKLIAKKNYAIRFKTPENQTVRSFDLLKGEVEVKSSQIDDKILYKNDKNPTYHFANVVDDHLMEISHVIRGEEWLPSLPLHWLLYEAFGWKKPKFIHLPLILKPTGKGKLSKRDGDRFGFPVFPVKWQDENTQTPGYKETGFLPEATVNFLALLGWNPGNEKEIFTLAELKKEFSIKKLNNSNARFDPEKNTWFNHQHIQLLDEGFLIETLKRELVKENASFNKKQLADVIRLVKPRLNLITDLYLVSKYFFESPKTYDNRAVTKLVDPDTLKTIKQIILCIENCKQFEAKEIKISLEKFSKQAGLEFGKALKTLRLGIVGELSGADLFKTIEIIGKTATKERMAALGLFIQRAS